MTHISTIYVLGGVAVALALSTSSAWAPIYMNNNTPQVHVPTPKPPPPKIMCCAGGHFGKLNSVGGGAGKLNTPSVTSPGVHTNPKALNPQPLPPG